MDLNFDRVSEVFANDTAQLQGVWKRLGRQLGDDPLTEVTDVTWIQFGHRYVDFRVPHDLTTPAEQHHWLDAQQAFSGTLDLDHGTATFTHDFEVSSQTRPELDRSTLLLFGDYLFELGLDFLEVWKRTRYTEAEARVDVTEKSECRYTQFEPHTNVDGNDTVDLVLAGDLAIATWTTLSSGSALFRRSDERWVVVATVGDDSVVQRCLDELNI